MCCTKRGLVGDGPPATKGHQHPGPRIKGVRQAVRRGPSVLLAGPRPSIVVSS